MQLDSWLRSWETLRDVSSLEGIIHLNWGCTAMIDARTEAALNNPYHAG